MRIEKISAESVQSKKVGKVSTVWRVFIVGGKSMSKAPDDINERFREEIGHVFVKYRDMVVQAAYRTVGNKADASEADRKRRGSTLLRLLQ
jgi:hypothetical protein